MKPVEGSRREPGPFFRGLPSLMVPVVDLCAEREDSIMRLRGAFPSWAAALALPLLVPWSGPASAEALIKKSYLPIELAYDALIEIDLICRRPS